MKNRKNVLNFENEKNRFSKIENNFSGAGRFEISKRLDQSFQNFSNRFEKFQNGF